MRRPRWPIVVALLALLAGGGVWAVRARPHPTVTPSADEATAQLDEARALLKKGQLDEAELRLRALHLHHDSVAVEESLSQLAERRGNRLAALAHLHRAIRISPSDPDARVLLGQLLLRLSQPDSACRELQIAAHLGRSPATDKDLRNALSQARCSGQF